MLQAVERGRVMEKGKAMYQQNLFGKPEIVSGDRKKKKGKGIFLRKVIAARVTAAHWKRFRAVAERKGLTSSQLLGRMIERACR